MIKVKVFDENHEDILTEKINNWIAQNLKYEIKDIKFSVSCMNTDYDEVYCFSALIMYEDNPKEYKPKKYEIIEKSDN